MIKKQLLIFLITLLSFTNINAQFGMDKKSEQAKSLKELTLLVLLDQTDEFNENIKSAIKSNWKYNEKVDFVTKDELSALQKDKKQRDNYAYLAYGRNGQRGLYPGNSIRVSFLDKATPIYYTAVDSEYRYLKNGNSDIVFTNKVEDITKADLIFSIKNLNNYIESFSKYKKMSRKEAMKALSEQSKHLSVLKDKKLLIEENTLSKNLLKKIKSVYKYDYEIVSKDQIDDAILNDYEDKVYIKGMMVIQPQMRDSEAVSDEILTSYATLSTITYSIYDSKGNEAIYTFVPLKKVSLSVGKAITKLSIKDFEFLAKSMK